MASKDRSDQTQTRFLRDEAIIMDYLKGDLEELRQRRMKEPPK
jgi:hypothetical protein